MHPTKPFPDPSTARSVLDEADIGSGEKTPGQLETEKIIGDIPPLPPQDLDTSEDRAEGDAAGTGRERREHDASLLRDEPSDNVDGLDPAPPKGS